MLVAHIQPDLHNVCFGLHEIWLQLKAVFALVGATPDQELEQIFSHICARRYEQKIAGYDENEFYRRLLLYDKGYRIGGKLTDSLNLLSLVVAPKEQEDDAFQLAVSNIDSFRKSLNASLLRAHPVPFIQGSQTLMRDNQGDNVKVAVFDVFEPRMLELQRKLYPNAKILENKKFGNPVQLNHGNVVIDAILSVAPHVEILPVSSDAQSSSEAIEFIDKEEDVFIVNMSRALTPGQGENRIQDLFKKRLTQLSKHKILVKALGNSGTDLLGKLTPARRELGMEITGDLSSYDTGLIREFLVDLHDDLLVLVENLDIGGNSAALSATIPGDIEGALRRTVCAPGEGFYSLSTGNFESGSSFAAPMVSATAALLLQHQKKCCWHSKLSAIVSSLGKNESLTLGDSSLAMLKEIGCE